MGAGDVHVLVTGARGFVGGCLATALARHGFSVTATHRHGAPVTSGDAPLRWVRTDLTKPQGLPERIDAVVHAAALLGDPDTPVSALIDANVTATQAVLAAARAAGARRFIHLSSTSVYGRIAAGTIDEATLTVDPDPYGLTKLLAEKLLCDAAPDLDGMALRLPGVIGPGAHRNFLAVTLGRLSRDEAVAATNPDAPFNNAVHVCDLAAFVIRLLIQGWSGFDTLVLGARGMTTIRGAIERMAAACDSRSSLTFHPAVRPAFTIDSRRACMEYGYDPGDILALLDRFAREQPYEESGR